MLRLCAFFSADTKLLSFFQQGGDIYVHTAALLFGVTPDMVTPSMRVQAKTVCLGILYGMTAHALAVKLSKFTGNHVGVDAASRLQRTFLSTFPGVAAYLLQCKEQCRALGFVSTIAGRRRYITGSTSADFSVRATAERQAVNSIIQGVCVCVCVCVCV